MFARFAHGRSSEFKPKPSPPSHPEPEGHEGHQGHQGQNAQGILSLFHVFDLSCFRELSSPTLQDAVGEVSKGLPQEGLSNSSFKNG